MLRRKSMHDLEDYYANPNAMESVKVFKLNSPKTDLKTKRPGHFKRKLQTSFWIKDTLNKIRDYCITKNVFFLLILFPRYQVEISERTYFSAV